MSNIDKYLQDILDARYGEEVRTAIHDSIYECYTGVVTETQSAYESAEQAKKAAETSANDSRDSYYYSEIAKRYAGSAEPLVSNNIQSYSPEIKGEKIRIEVDVKEGDVVKVEFDSLWSASIEGFVNTSSGAIGPIKYDSWGGSEWTYTAKKDVVKIDCTFTNIPVVPPLPMPTSATVTVNGKPYKVTTNVLPQSANSTIKGMRVDGYTKKDESGLHYGGSMGLVDLGTLTWAYDTSSTPKRFYATVSGKKKPSASRTEANLYIDGYTTISDGRTTDFPDKCLYSIASSELVYIVDNSFTDANAFKTAMQGVMLAFEPSGSYNGQYALAVESNNKNLFNPKVFTDYGMTETNGEYSGSASLIVLKDLVDYKFKENTQYTISFDIKVASDGHSGRISIDYSDGTTNRTAYINSTEYTHYELVSRADKTITKIYYGYSSNRTITIKNVQLEEGTEETSYAPYRGKTTLIPLNATLCDGDYLDTDEGVEHHANTTANVSEYTWTYSSSRVAFNRQFSDYKIGEIIISDEYTWGGRIGSASDVTNKPDMTIWYQDNGQVFIKDSRYTTLADSQSKIIYPLANPTTTQLTAEQIKAIHSVPTFAPETIISNTDNAPMVVSYVMDNASAKWVDGIESKVEEVNSGLDVLEFKQTELKMLGWNVPKECPVQNEVSGNTFIQKVGRIDLGTLHWEYSSTDNWFVSTEKINKKFGSGVTTLYLYGYTSVRDRGVLEDKCVAPYNQTSSNNIVIKDLNFADLASFTDYINGKYLYYELDTPITMQIDGNEAVEKLNESIGSFNFLNKSIAATSSLDISIPNGYKGMVITNGTQVAQRSVYLINATGSGAVSVTPILTGSNIVCTGSTNNLNIAHNQTGFTLTVSILSFVGKVN